ncbi:hypothetical protein FRC12_005863, partial [Ceratobasidium sp. 428]
MAHFRGSYGINIPNTQPAPNTAVSAPAIASACMPMPYADQSHLCQTPRPARKEKFQAEGHVQAAELFGLSNNLSHMLVVQDICAAANFSMGKCSGLSQCLHSSQGCCCVLNNADKSVQDIIKETRNTTIEL